MSKAKALLKGAQGTLSVLGVIGTVTGHGLVHIAAASIGYRLQSGQLRLIAKYQADSASKAFKDAATEWNSP